MSLCDFLQRVNPIYYRRHFSSFDKALTKTSLSLLGFPRNGMRARIMPAKENAKVVVYNKLMPTRLNSFFSLFHKLFDSSYSFNNFILCRSITKSYVFLGLTWILFSKMDIS